MLSNRQQEIITGSLLGDGTIWTNFIDPLMKYQLSQSKLDYQGDDKKTYILWYVQEFMDVGCSVRPRRVKAEGMIREISGEREYDKYIFTTRCHQMWNEIEKKWYVPRDDHTRFKRRKIVPNELKLTPLTLCVWHMEDGSNYPKDANITLETQSFTEEEVEFLIERLKEDLDITATKKKTKKSQFRMFVGRKSYFEFIELVKPHIEWDCFKYKIDTSKYTKKTQKGSDHSQSKLTDKLVSEIFQLREEGMLQKEIATKVGTTQSNVSQILSGKRWRK